MKTIKDLFIEEQMYTVQYELNDKYCLFIEALDEFGNHIQEEKFNKYAITKNTFIYLHKYGYGCICEWYGPCQFKAFETLEHLEKVMNFAIEQYESEQGDED